jgi:hypothetical protein
MRSKRNFLLLPALLCAAALAVAACNRGGTQPQPGESAAERQAAASNAPNAAGAPTGPGGQPQVNELRPEPQSVVVEKAPPSSAPELSRQEQDLADRERRLAERQAALDARERRLPAAARRASPGHVRGASPTEERQQMGAEPRQEADSSSPQQENRPGPPGAPAAGEPGSAADTAAGVTADEPQPGPPPAASAMVPSGTSFEVEFTRGLASNTSSAGDTFRARVVSDVVGADGLVAIPAGSEVLGVVTDAVALGRVGGRAKLGLKFTDVVLPSGSTAPLHASLVEEGKSKTGRDAATIGGSTAGGAILGHILSSGSRGRGSIIGALIGAAVGTAIAAKTPGDEVVIPEGSVLELRLDEAVIVSH